MKLSEMQNNPEVETEGVWQNYGGGLRVKIARMSNPKYEEYLREQTKPHMRRLRSGNLENDVIEEITQKAMARYILLNWEGLKDENDQEIPYSEKKAFELLSDPKYKDFYRDISDMSQDRSLFRSQALEELAKY